MSVNLDMLNAEQRSAVVSDAQYVRILAGAGTGKTRALTHRIAYQSEQGSIDPRSVLAVTFTRKAAVELRTRLSHMGVRDHVTAGTFHATAWAQLRARWAERGVRPPSLLDRKARFVARIAPTRDSARLLELVGEIEWASARLVGPDDYPRAALAAGRGAPLGDYHKTAAVIAEYAEQKLKRRVVDFDDVLRLAARDLMSDPAYRRARQWRHRHLFVDEFQDVNPSQFELLRGWLGPESTLCVVGDPNQAIYGWNGADPEFINRLDRWFEGMVSFELVQNYRSTPQVLGCANQLLGRGASAGLRPNRGDGPIPTITAHADVEAEAAAIALAVRSEVDAGTPLRHIAVLVRTNAQVGAIAEALDARHLAYRSRAGVEFLRQPEVADALRHIASAASFETAITDLERDLLRRQRILDRTSSAESSAEFRRNADPELAAYIDLEAESASTANEERDRQQADALGELLRLAYDFRQMDPVPSAAGFAEWLRTTMAGERVDDDGEAIELMSFHAAKGLEWPVVHIAGCEDGLIPIHYAKTPAAAAEEQRLLYVAMTRAERSLSFHWAASRTFGSRTAKRRRSPLLEPVEEAMTWLRTGERPVKAPPLVRPARRQRKEVSTDPLAVALRQWRRGAAKAADVPAYVVFSDAVLDAIVDGRPRSKAQLLAIPGIGPTKLDRFGAAILELVASHPAD